MLSESTRPAGARTGILFFSLGILMFALNDALGKWIMADYTAQQLLLVRSLGASLVLIPLAWRTPGRIRPRGLLSLHALRIALMTGDSFAFYFATKYLPLADVMTFYLAAPLIITALSVPLLGERVGPFRWSAVLVGFVGVVIALRPTGSAVSGAAMIALAGCIVFSCSILITRKLRDSHWLGLTLSQFVGSGVVGALTSPIGWVTPGPWDLLLMVAVGIMAMAAFIAITKALTLADASAVAPFHYTSIVWAVILGWLIWGDVPDRNTTIGILIIMASGLAVWWREQRRDIGASAAVAAP